MEWREILYIREWWSVVLETKRGGRRQDLICLEKGRKQKKKKKKKRKKYVRTLIIRQVRTQHSTL